MFVVAVAAVFGVAAFAAAAVAAVEFHERIGAAVLAMAHLLLARCFDMVVAVAVVAPAVVESAVHASNRLLQLLRSEQREEQTASHSREKAVNLSRRC